MALTACIAIDTTVYSNTISLPTLLSDYMLLPIQFPSILFSTRESSAYSVAFPEKSYSGINLISSLPTTAQQ